MSKVQPLWPDQQAARIATDAELDAIRAEIADITTGALPDGSVTNAKLANMPADTVKARLSSNGVPTDVTLATLRVALAITAGDISGLGALATLNALANVTQLGAGGTPDSSKFLRGDFTWALPAGEGPPFDDDGSLLQNLADPTKELRLALAAITTGTQRLWTVPDQDINFTPGQTYQAADADLTALAAMTDPAGLLASALQPAEIAAGAITPATGALDLTGLDGQVLTLDASGNIAPADAAAGAPSINQYEVLARVAAGAGAASGLDPVDLTEEETPALGDFLLGWESGGGLRKFDVGDLPSAGGAPTGASYLALAAHASLTAERVFTPGPGLTGTDAGANSTYGLEVDPAKLVTGGDAKIRDATASQDGLATAALAATGILANKGPLVPGSIDLSSSGEHDPYTQTGAIAFALVAVTEIPGAYSTVRITGNGSAITWSADFEEIQGGALDADDYAGFTGLRRLLIYWSGAQGKAQVALSRSDKTAAEILAALLTVDGPASGLDADLLDGQHASALLARANHTGTQTLATISDASPNGRSLVSAADYAAMRALLQIPEVIPIAVSNETTDLTTGALKVRFRMPFAMTLSAVRASVSNAPTGAAIIVDINEEGVSILSTKLSIDATEKTSTTAQVPAVISDAALADDAQISIDIDQIGSIAAGAGLKVQLHGVRA